VGTAGGLRHKAGTPCLRPSWPCRTAPSPSRQGATLSLFRALRRVLCGPPSAADAPLPEWLTRAGGASVAPVPVPAHVPAPAPAAAPAPAPAPAAAATDLAAPPTLDLEAAGPADGPEAAGGDDAGGVAAAGGAPDAASPSGDDDGGSKALQQLLATKGTSGALNLVAANLTNGTLSVSSLAGNGTARSAAGAAAAARPLLLLALALAAGALAC
jgi:hypothetical protein